MAAPALVGADSTASTSEEAADDASGEAMPVGGVAVLRLAVSADTCVRTDGSARVSGCVTGGKGADLDWVGAAACTCGRTPCGAERFGGCDCLEG